MNEQRHAASVLTPKEAVKRFWDEAPCGANLYLPGNSTEAFDSHFEARYRLEPYIANFACFADAAGADVLEIGVGLGADHQRLAEAGANLSGVDLTPAAVEHTARRLSQRGLSSNLQVADAERLPFPDGSFDLVYSWGVIHHTPHTEAAAREILRVLRPGARYKVMIYHRWSLVGLMLWLRYGIIQRLSLTEVYARYLESPGTKAYSRREAAAMFPGAKIRIVASPGDLLEGGAGQRHKGALLTLARKMWPRPLIRRFGNRLGLFMLIEGTRGAAPSTMP